MKKILVVFSVFSFLFLGLIGEVSAQEEVKVEGAKDVLSSWQKKETDDFQCPAYLKSSARFFFDLNSQLEGQGENKYQALLNHFEKKRFDLENGSIDQIDFDQTWQGLKTKMLQFKF